MRYTQPQTLVEVDWANPITRKLNSCVNMATLLTQSKWTVPKATSYSSPVVPAPTPYGIGLGDPAYGGSTGAGAAIGLDYNYTSGELSLFSTFYLKNKAGGSATPITLVGTDSGTSWQSASGTATATLYWTYIGGSFTIEGKAAWNNPYFVTAGVDIQPGLHTAVFVINKGSAYIVLDGVVIASNTTANLNYYPAYISLGAYEAATMYSSGAGAILHKGCFLGRIEEAQAIELSKNTWQIYKDPIRKFPIPSASVTLPTVVYPNSDISTGLWTSTGPNLWSAIDEPNTPSNADYIEVVGSSTCQMGLETFGYPIGSNCQLTFTGSSANSSTITITVKNADTSTVLTWVQALTPTDTTYNRALSVGEQAAINSGTCTVTLVSS